MYKDSRDNKRDDLAWEEIATEHIIKNEWIDFRKSTFRFPDGTVFEPYYSYSRKDYVVIVPFDEEGNLICVRQYRQGIREVTTEFPAGGIERSDGREYGNGKENVEEALLAAKRELKEETGFESDDWTHLITVPSNATIADNYAFVYMAKGCRKVSGQNLDDTEFLNVEINTPEYIEGLIKSGGFQQSVHVMAWLLAKESAAL
ncbi:NUDIX hydrolase [Butyrivibrio sp. AE3004]|uniref:NUDIX hydrolase n=1 Tax=Butyrivibrio sp. AE3004 TaxID=1506994 RepID=UPI00055F73A1|nr:NUDIX hydrolase [Butyrivibrio sp. AE3004]